MCSFLSSTMPSTAEPEVKRRVEKEELWTKKEQMHDNIVVIKKTMKNLQDEVGKLKSMKKTNFRAVSTSS